MSEKRESKTAPAPEKQNPANVIPLGPVRCASEECKKRPERAGFCSEHYTWFKEGLITMDGYKARDFDKKYHDWMRRSAKAA